jgi:nucleoid-associated protein YgaU
LLGAGWLIYEPGRDVPQPIAETAGPSDAADGEVERTATEPPATSPPGTAGDNVAQAPAVPSVTPERPATEASESGEAASERFASPPATSEIPAPQPAAAPSAAGQEPVVAAAPPALAPEAAVIAPLEPPVAERARQTAALEQDSTPASAPAADQEPPAAAGEREADWARLRELAPGAGAPSLPGAPRSADQAREPSEGTAATVARATPAPDVAAEPDQSAGVGGAATPAEAARLATEAEVVEPSAPPAAVTPSGPAAGDKLVERVPAASLVLDTIRRALAALLGGPPEATDLPGQSAATVEEPPAPVAAARPGSSEEPGAGEPEPVRPSFDIVRVERDGRTVVAGRAAPNAEVELRAGDRVIDRVRANRRGEWVATPLEPLAPGGQELTVAARSAGAPAIEAEQVVVVVVPGPPQPQSAAVAVATPPAEPVAVLLPKRGGGGGRILQAPGRLSSDGKLALVVLDYDEAGRTRLTGEAPPGVPVRIYVDDQPSAEVLVEPSGQWTAVLDQQLAPGDYTLRLDQLGGEGRPVARLETPFTRVSQPPVAGEAQVDYVIVQPGNSLWRIARRLFGNGFKYVHIYDANQAQIRDPDLIYPGQVFEIPAAAGAAG